MATKLYGEIRPPEIRTNVDFVTHVENTLGWLPDPRKPVWKARCIEAAKLKRKRAQNPRLYTIENLCLAVEYLRRQRMGVTSPVGVCWHVERALEYVTVDDSTEIDRAIGHAVAEEMKRRRPDGQIWITRLVRAQGPAREDVYQEWAEARGG